MQIRPLSPALGAEVVDFDARAVPSRPETETLRAAYREHHLLCLRDQTLDADAQERFVAQFGPLIDETGGGELSGRLTNVGDDSAGACALPFHSDFTFTPAPAQGIALYALELPAEPTSTWYTSGVRAAATLPAELRRRVQGRTATHAMMFFATGDAGARARDHVGLDGAVPRHGHPVLRVHPRTGEEVLFVTDLHVERIDGLADDDSRALIEALLAHAYQPTNVYEHRWRLGDLVVWDNEALQHRRPDVTGATPRTFRRNSLNTVRSAEMFRQTA